MTTYYVRKSGSDAAAGTSAATAWATIGKALLAGGMASGDTVYVGAGIYRQAITVGITPTATTSIIGDVDGSRTGDPGEVRLTSASSDFSGGSNSTPLNLNTKNYLAFSNIVFEASGTAAPVTNLGGHDISFTDCAFFSFSLLTITTTVNVASNLTFDRCYVCNLYAGGGISLTMPTSTIADYDANILIQNCIILTGGIGITINSSGVNSFKGGGVDIRSCSIFTPVIGISAANANVATSIPSTVYDCWIVSGSTGLNAVTLGQITEDYNLVAAVTPRANVTAGTHASTIARVTGLIHMGQERIWGGQPRPFGAPVRDSLVHSWGSQSGGPSVDMLNRPRPAGANRVLFTGTATAGAATTLTNSAATWGTNQLAGAVCKITGGTGSGQTKLILSNTLTVLTFYGNWHTTPDNTSTYAIYFGTPSESGIATAGSTTTLTQGSASWVTNMWAGFIVEITAGTAAGQITTITSNTGTVLTFPTITAPDNTSKFVIYKQTSVDASNRSAGCFERHDTAEKETGTTDAGSVGLVLTGWADHAIYVPVDAASTTISVRARFNATHGTTNKPQAVLDANGEIGVTTETKTMTSAADTWETLTFTAQTPTAKGWVTVRLLSRSDAAIGKAFFDTLVAA